MTSAFSRSSSSAAAAALAAGKTEAAAAEAAPEAAAAAAEEEEEGGEEPAAAAIEAALTWNRLKTFYFRSFMLTAEHFKKILFKTYITQKKPIRFFICLVLPCPETELPLSYVSAILFPLKTFKS